MDIVLVTVLFCFSNLLAIRHNGAVVAQMFGAEGFSQMAVVNTTAVLVEESSNPGGISGGGKHLESLIYEFSDAEYKWNNNRDLKAKEPFTSSGMSFSLLGNGGGASGLVLLAPVFSWMKS